MYSFFLQVRKNKKKLSFMEFMEFIIVIFTFFVYLQKHLIVNHFNVYIPIATSKHATSKRQNK